AAIPVATGNWVSAPSDLTKTFFWNSRDRSHILEWWSMRSVNWAWIGSSGAGTARAAAQEASGHRGLGREFRSVVLERYEWGQCAPGGRMQGVWPGVFDSVRQCQSGLAGLARGGTALSRGAQNAGHSDLSRLSAIRSGRSRDGKSCENDLGTRFGSPGGLRHGRSPGASSHHKYGPGHFRSAVEDR